MKTTKRPTELTKLTRLLKINVNELLAFEQWLLVEYRESLTALMWRYGWPAETWTRVYGEFRRHERREAAPVINPANITAEQFDEIYDPLEAPESSDNAGSLLWDEDDPEDLDVHFIWTVVTGDDDRLYAQPLLRDLGPKVNVVGYCVTAKPWVTGEECAVFSNAANNDRNNEGSK